MDIFDSSVDNVKVEISKNRLLKGEEINLTSKDPTLKNVLIGVGWDLLSFETNPIDLDLSCFLLGKNGKTRVDSDFVFYNNIEGSNGAVVHNGDNRTGAGDGDDETMSLNLNDIPFDVTQIIFTVTIYRGDEKEMYLSKLRNSYIRIVNRDNSKEIMRYEFAPEIEDQKETGMLAASLFRDGPKWHFKALGELVPGGMTKIATNYDIIVTGG